VSGFLDDAFAEAERRVTKWRRDGFLSALRHEPASRAPGSSFTEALRSCGSIALIAEIKRASPLRGSLAGDVDVASRARLYVEAGAAAVSVLTESQWFGGSIDDLGAARRLVQAPLLRKDFIVDEYDLEVSAVAGADAVLLIAARFEVGRLRNLLLFARELGLDVLVETHDDGDAAVACEAGAEIIGVNSRNLRTLQVDVNGALRALRRLPPDRVKVLESGIGSPCDIQSAIESGANAVLVGELLMRSSDPAATIRLLLARSDAANRLRAVRNGSD